ncbi:MAG: BON domain-containing protein [Limnobacter sp.]|nr:BON domain-containing protein [Limnobacter sp.]
MNKILVKTLIASGVALLSVGAVHAADTHRADKPKSTVGQYVDDSTITAKVKAKHAEDKVVSALDVNVETKQGVVILSGTSASDVEKTRAEALALQVEGVKSVSNKIDIKPKS